MDETNASAGPFLPFSEEWAAAFVAAINRSSTYKIAGRTWVWPLALTLDVDPEFGFETETSVILDLYEGTCRSFRLETGVPDAPFVLRGRYIAWRRLMREGLDPIMCIVKGQLRLTGQLTAIMAHVDAARLLVACARSVPTAFADDPPLGG